MTWRSWLVFAGAGCAGALAFRGDWLAAAGAAVAVSVPVAWWVRGQMAATRAGLRRLEKMREVARNYSRINP